MHPADQLAIQLAIQAAQKVLDDTEILDEVDPRGAAMALMIKAVEICAKAGGKKVDFMTMAEAAWIHKKGKG